MKKSIWIANILIFLFVLQIEIIDGNKFNGYSSSDSDNVYHGRYTRYIRGGSLLIPRRVTENGGFYTYELPKFYEPYGNDERGRRSTTASKDNGVHLILPFAGADHHVELEPHHDFVSPWFVIETRTDLTTTSGRNATTINADLRRGGSQLCHYRGAVRGRANSRAALSLCDGVAGYLLTDRGMFFIEPLHKDVPDVDGRHVHVIYKREIPQARTGKPFCGTNDDWESAWTSRLQQQQRLRTVTSIDDDNNDKPTLSVTSSIHRYIEVALVADRRFLDFHRGTNHEQYLLTVMNMVSDFYHDASIGNQIDVVVVRMIYLEKEKQELDLQISPRAEKTLESFAKWAEKINPADPEHPNHFDVSALVTRYDLCAEGNNCDLMGLAYVAAACDRNKAATINEDSGLLLGVVIAHEIGHTLGCAHDNEEISGCSPQDKDQSYFVMSPLVFIFTIRWSTCSRKFITSFLESGLGDCLNNNPKNPPAKYKYPDMLPGAMYDANFQCNLDYPGAKVCESEKNNCELLWCKVGNACKSRGLPMADGTKCDDNKWCIHKKCVKMGSRGAAINGGWGNWGKLSECSRNCGGGVRYSERECDNPVPYNGGRYCVGERKKFSVCNVQPCDASQPSYRAVQCAEFDDKKILPEGIHKWEPYLGDEVDVCALYCIDQERSYMKLSPTVKDGTPCKFGSRDMCIGGVCRKVGCDWIIDSDAVEDVCGVCKGGGTKCTKVEGDYNKVEKPGYVTIVKIPKGSKSIRAVENKDSGNTLAVKLGKKDKYCLNGDHVEQQDNNYPCAGAIIVYKHIKPGLEEIMIKGPLKEPIDLQYVFYQLNNPGVHYEYYVDKPDTSYTPKYSWEFIEWSDCDAKCGGGTKISTASCTEARAGKVVSEFCKNIPQPSPKSQTCNEASCPAKWRVSQWSRCSGCGGKTGEMRRKVECARPGARKGEDYVQANLEACEGKPPTQLRKCTSTEPCIEPCTSNDYVNATAAPPANLSSEIRERMIENIVDYGLVRYLEKSRAIVNGEETSKVEDGLGGDELERMLREWAQEEVEGEQVKRTCGEGECNDAVSGVKFTTPVPGSIIIDKIPKSKNVIYEKPVVDVETRRNMSDVDYQNQPSRAAGYVKEERSNFHQGKKATEYQVKLMSCSRKGRRRRRPDKKKRSESGG